ncbi:MAG: hypothetical protein K8S14_01800 [Actinomycetia bacterium]|nr:hypothetical protein [Actinomycetes bacterium]
MHLLAAEGISILSERMVGSSQSISSIEDVKELKHVYKKLKKSAKKIIETNLDLAGSLSPVPGQASRGYKNE